MQEGLNPKNLVRSSFYLNDFYELIDETFWAEGIFNYKRPEYIIFNYKRPNI